MAESHETVIIGAGIAALAHAFHAGVRGRNVTLLADSRSGAASGAAAGMLAPSVEPAAGKWGDIAFLARDYYPEFLQLLADSSGADVPFALNGIIEFHSHWHPRNTPAAGSSLSAHDLRSLEPEIPLNDSLAATLHPGDGWVDNQALMRSLRAALHKLKSVTVREEPATHLHVEPNSVQIATPRGTIHTSRVLVATGAWTSTLPGLPSPPPVEPVRGQILVVHGVRLRHVLVGPAAYAVPRQGNTALLGSTMERVGFDPTTTDAGILSIRNGVLHFSTLLSTAVEKTRWAGLRPMVPGGLPVAAPDPAAPMIEYALGYGRNGILLAPFLAQKWAESL